MTAPEVPRVPVVKVVVSRGVRTVRVRCPFCAKIHSHGWPLGRTEPGGRGSHCVRVERRPYRVVLPDEALR